MLGLPRGDGELVKESDIPVGEVKPERGTREDVVEGVVAGVLRLPPRPRLLDPAKVVKEPPPLGVGQELVRLSDLDKLVFCTRIVVLVWVPINGFYNRV